MTTITAKIIADSIGRTVPRLTTMELRYPRVIHSEFMTHRVFSRNASSSRAIPVRRLIEDVQNDPFIPLHWGKNEKGVQANEELSGQHLIWAKAAYREGLNAALSAADTLAQIGAHKQLVNRILEPYSHINVVVTSTEWSNFFALRDHLNAEPHICLLAQAMKKALAESTPRKLLEGDWHLPYLEPTDYRKHAFQRDLIKVSVARCARVSYKTYDGRVPDFDEDLALANRLLGSIPLHASPAEHQAKVDAWAAHSGSGGFCGNFAPGWIQYRKILVGENQ